MVKNKYKDCAVFLLDRIFDVPKYEGFASKNDEISFLGNEFLSSGFTKYDRKKRCWKAPILSSVWKTVEVIGRVWKYNDYPCVDCSIPAFSQRAVDVLCDILYPNGELLPLSSPLGKYYAYNVTTVADVLDLKKSIIDWDSESNTASSIERYEFVPEKVAGLSIFRLPQMGSEVYVTEPFVARVREQGLKGFNLTKLWPLPARVKWWKLQKDNIKRFAKEGLAEGETVKGNTLVVVLNTTRNKPSKVEEAHLNRLTDRVDDILVEQESMAQAAGCLEGVERVPGQYRLFLSCPDADELAKKLWPWLKSLDWKGEVNVVKRFGEYVDASAREEYVDLSSDEPGKSVAVRETPLSDEAREKIKADAERGREMLGLPHRAAMAKTQETIEKWIEDYRRRKHPKLNPEEAAEIVGAFWGQSLCNNFDWQWAMVNRCDQEFCGVVSLMRDCVVFPIDQIHTLMTNPEMLVNTREVHKMIKSKKIPPTKPKGYLILGTPLPSMQPIVPP